MMSDCALIFSKVFGCLGLFLLGFGNSCDTGIQSIALIVVLDFVVGLVCVGANDSIDSKHGGQHREGRICKTGDFEIMVEGVPGAVESTEWQRKHQCAVQHQIQQCERCLLGNDSV